MRETPRGTKQLDVRHCTKLRVTSVEKQRNKSGRPAIVTQIMVCPIHPFPLQFDTDRSRVLELDAA